MSVSGWESIRAMRRAPAEILCGVSEQRSAAIVWNHAADLSRGNTVTMKGGKCGIGQFGNQCNEQTSRSLRIEKQVLIFERNAVGEMLRSHQ